MASVFCQGSAQGKRNCKPEKLEFKNCPPMPYLPGTSPKEQVNRKGSVWLAPGKNLLGQFLANLEVFGKWMVSSPTSAGLSRGAGAQAGPVPCCPAQNAASAQRGSVSLPPGRHKVTQGPMQGSSSCSLPSTF